MSKIIHFPRGDLFSLCHWCIFAKRFNTANIRGFKVGHRKKCAPLDDAGVHFYTRPLGGVSQQEVGAYQ